MRQRMRQATLQIVQMVPLTCAIYNRYRFFCTAYNQHRYPCMTSNGYRYPCTTWKRCRYLVWHNRYLCPVRCTGGYTAKLALRNTIWTSMTKNLRIETSMTATLCALFTSKPLSIKPTKEPIDVHKCTYATLHCVTLPSSFEVTSTCYTWMIAIFRIPTLLTKQSRAVQNCAGSLKETWIRLKYQCIKTSWVNCRWGAKFHRYPCTAKRKRKWSGRTDGILQVAARMRDLLKFSICIWDTK